MKDALQMIMGGGIIYLWSGDQAPVLLAGGDKRTEGTFLFLDHRRTI